MKTKYWRCFLIWLMNLLKFHSIEFVSPFEKNLLAHAIETMYWLDDMMKLSLIEIGCESKNENEPDWVRFFSMNTNDFVEMNPFVNVVREYIYDIFVNNTFWEMTENKQKIPEQRKIHKKWNYWNVIMITWLIDNTQENEKEKENEEYTHTFVCRFVLSLHSFCTKYKLRLIKFEEWRQ